MPRENVDRQEDLEWMQSGLCKGSPAKIFFQYDVVRDRLAKAICQGCPVREPCLQYALDNDETGVWGGTNDKDRDRLRRTIYVRQSLQVSQDPTSRHSRLHEPTHLASEYLSSQQRTSCSQIRSRPALSKAAELSSVSFPGVRTAF